MNIPEINEIVERVKVLNKRLKHENLEVPKNDIDALNTEFQQLNKHIFGPDPVGLDLNDRLEQIVDVLTAIGDLDFSKQAKVTESYGHYDYIALSINLMIENLRERIEEMQHLTSAFKATDKVIVTTTLKGEIVAAVGLEKLGIKLSDYKGRGIQMLFNAYKVRDNFMLDFTNSVSAHNINQGVTSSNSEFILRIHAKKTGTGYVYKVTPMQRDLREDYTYPIYLNTFNFENTPEEKREYLINLKQMLAAKPVLDFSEIKMLNSINEILKGENPDH